MARKIIPYKPALKEIARGLRNNSTLGEVLLWKKLRNKLRRRRMRLWRKMNGSVTTFTAKNRSTSLSLISIAMN
jgi:very-short-patch-repair endonuclease